MMIILALFGLRTGFAFSSNFTRYKQNSEFQKVLNEAKWSLETTKVMLEEYLINPGPRSFRQLTVKYKDFKTDKAFESLNKWNSQFSLVNSLANKWGDFLFIVDLLIDQINTQQDNTPLYKETVAQAFLISHEMSLLMIEISVMANEQITKDTWFFIGSLTISFAVLVLFVFFMVLWGRRRVLGRVVLLDDASRRIAEGDYSKEIDVSGSDELTRLAQSFQIMQNSVWNHLKAQAQEKERLSTILHSIGDAVIAVDCSVNVTLMNPIAELLTGWTFEEAQGRNLDEVFNIFKEKSREKQDSPVLSVLETGEIKQLANHTLLVSRSGLEYQIADSAAPLRTEDGKVEGVVLVFRDVTEHKHMQDLMIQSEKMLSVGGLAAGMAHEINNPLSGMMQTASVIHTRLSEDLPANIDAAIEVGISLESLRMYMERRGIFRMLDMVKESGSRIGKIVNNMLSFARKSPNQVSGNNLGELVDYAIELAATDYDMKKSYDFRNIKIKRNYEESLPLVPCDSGQIQQVVLNLLRNGAQAFLDAETIEPCFTIHIYVDSEQNMICIEVSDNGPGMDEELRRRVFEPFFTTKPVGVGTGLGLSVSYFIISENHQGEMEVKSSPGQGSTFIVRLPLVRDSLI